MCIISNSYVCEQSKCFHDFKTEQVVYVHVHSLFHIGVKRSGSIGDQTILLDDDVLKTIHDALITFMFDDY